MSHSIDDDFELKVFEPIFKTVEQALINALGYDIELLKLKNNSPLVAYPRMIFSYLCIEKGIPHKLVGKKIKRDRTTILSQLQSYNRYYGNDKTFTLMANVVIKCLKEIEYGK